MEVKDGQLYIVHVHTKSWLGIDIRLFERIRYGKWSWSNHSALLVQDNGVWYLYEANPKVMRTNWTVWQTMANAAGKKYEITIIPEKYHKKQLIKPSQLFAEQLNALLGDGYDYVDLLLYQPISMFFGLYIQDNNKTKFICSRFVTCETNKVAEIFKETNIAPAPVFEIMSNLQL